MKWSAPPRPTFVSLEQWAEDFILAIGEPPGFRRILSPGVHFVRYADPLTVVVSGRTEADGKKWIHVSASHPNRPPTWATMCVVKERFLGDRRAIQVHVPRDQWVNLHPYCLHLWCCLDGDGLPDFRVVGSTGDLEI